MFGSIRLVYLGSIFGKKETWKNPFQCQKWPHFVLNFHHILAFENSGQIALEEVDFWTSPKSEKRKN